MLVKTRETTIEHPEYRVMTNDLLTTATRRLVLTTTITSGAWLLLLALIKAGEISLEIMPVLALVPLAYWLVGLQINRSLLWAQVTWLALFCLTVLLAFALFRTPEIIYLLALAPLVAVLMIGLRAAVAALVTVIGLLIAIDLQSAGALITPAQIGMVGFGAILAAAIGWSATSPLLTMVDWTNYSYRMAREKLEESRNQRIELAQVQEDLVLANKELTRLTNSLKVMTQRADEARRVKEEFVANVSHELRTPLNMIIGYTNLIMKSPTAYGKKLPARLLADISSVQRNSQHLVNLINDVLDLSQVDAGRMALSRSWSSIQEIIEAAVIAVQPLYISKQLFLSSKVPEQEVRVYCDRTRIREVVLNLLSNAGRFTEQGGVQVSAWVEAESLVVSVEDSGPGISPEDQQRIFEPFQQVDPVLHHQSGGSGLGLTISKRFVEMHAGQMWLDSQPGKGTTFFFRIPLSPVLDDFEQQAGAGRWFSPYQEYNPRTRRNKAPRAEYVPRFVVMEEYGGLKHLFERYLDRVEVLGVRSLAEASDVLRQGTAQALIINQPGENGTLQVFPEIAPQMPVIQCWIPGRDEAARQLGVVEYLVKPVPQEDLLAALDKIGGDGLSVLLVDDDIETLSLLARILSVVRPGIRVMLASDGEEALGLMREHQPGAVLLDLMLPGMNGYEILQVKGADPTISAIPVIVVSSTDPSGVPVVTSNFSVTRAEGLSFREFLDCLMAVSENLNSSPQKHRPELPESAPG